MGRLDGKIALITGAARGQGRSHAVHLAEEGADIIAVDLCADITSTGYPLADREDLAETVRLVEKLDRRIVAHEADVREPGALRAAVADGVAQLGGLDVVVANAGIAPMGNHDITAFADVVDVNLVGVLNTVHAGLPHLTDGGSVIAIGSVMAFLSGAADSPANGAGGAGYASAKRLLAAYIHDLSLQLAPRRIRANAIHPTNVDTPMLHSEPMYRAYRPDLPQPGRLDAEPAFYSLQAMPIPYVEASDVSHAVVYLASDESRYVTGAQLPVDAGALVKANPWHG